MEKDNALANEKAAHTPGPWYAVEFSGFYQILDRDYYEGRDMFNADEVGSEKAKLNASLAAAAPEMLEALKIAKKHIDGYLNVGNKDYQAICGAIKKAEPSA